MTDILKVSMTVIDVRGIKKTDFKCWHFNHEHTSTVPFDVIDILLF